MSETRNLDHLIQEHLQPFVRKIDSDAYYAEAYLKSIGEASFLDSRNGVDYAREVYVVEDTAEPIFAKAIMSF